MAMVSAENNQKAQNVGLKIGSPLMGQLRFGWSSTNKYAEWRKFRMEIAKMFQNYNISQAERVPIINSWLGR